VALSEVRIQTILASKDEARAENNESWKVVDGCLVIHDLSDKPWWLPQTDEDGNTNQSEQERWTVYEIPGPGDASRWGIRVAGQCDSEFGGPFPEEGEELVKATALEKAEQERDAHEHAAQWNLTKLLQARQELRETEVERDEARATLSKTQEEQEE
jgi:hypothetical protein